MKSKHTAGPWKASRAKNNRDRWHIESLSVIHNDDYGTSVCTTSHWLKTDSKGEEEANARLISIAPEMLGFIERNLGYTMIGGDAKQITKEYIAIMSKINGEDT